MFGFLRISRQSLTAADQKLYKAHFCAACHSMAEFGGRPSAFLANYDQTFLLLILAVLEGGDQQKSLPCTAFSLRRVTVQQFSPATRQAVAALNVALVDAKLGDDESDDGGWRPRLVRGMLSSKTRAAHQTLAERGFPLHLLQSLGERQTAAEAADQQTLDSLSDPTAALMEGVFAWAADLSQQAPHRAALAAAGDALGRYLYVWDALTDREADRKRGRFNAITACGGDLEAVRHYLTRQINQLERSLRTLPLGSRQALVEGLLTRMRQRLREVLPRPRLSLAQSLYWWRAYRRHQAGDCDASCCECADCGECACGCIDCSVCCTNGWWSCLGAIVLVIVILIVIGWYGSTHKHPRVSGPTPTPSVASSSRPSPRGSPASSPSQAPHGGVGGKPISP